MTCRSNAMKMTKIATRIAWVVSAVMCLVACGSQPSTESVLSVTVEQVNALTPIEVDEITRLDSASYSLPATLHYHYTLALDSLSAAERADMEAYMRSTLPTRLREEQGSEALSRLGVELQYRYNNPSGEALLELTIAPDEYAPLTE